MIVVMIIIVSFWKYETEFGYRFYSHTYIEGDSREICAQMYTQKDSREICAQMCTEEDF